MMLYFVFPDHSLSQSFSTISTVIRTLIIKVILSDPNGNANLPLASGDMMVCEWFVTSQFL